MNFLKIRCFIYKGFDFTQGLQRRETSIDLEYFYSNLNFSQSSYRWLH